jgi:hypothetical protein
MKEERGKREHQSSDIRGSRGSKRGCEQSPLLRRRSVVADVAGRSPFLHRAMAVIRPTSVVLAGADAGGVLPYGGGWRWLVRAAEPSPAPGRRVGSRWSPFLRRRLALADAGGWSRLLCQGVVPWWWFRFCHSALSTGSGGANRGITEGQDGGATERRKETGRRKVLPVDLEDVALFEGVDGWGWEKDFSYSARSGYRALFGARVDMPGALQIWRSRAPPNCKVFL